MNSVIVNLLCPICPDPEDDSFAGDIPHDTWIRRTCPEEHVYWWMALSKPEKGQPRIIFSTEDPTE